MLILNKYKSPAPAINFIGIRRKLGTRYNSTQFLYYSPFSRMSKLVGRGRTSQEHWGANDMLMRGQHKAGAKGFLNGFLSVPLALWFIKEENQMAATI